MPRNYKHKKRGKTLNYASDQLQKALEATQNGMSIRKAAQLFRVPKSTLADRVSGRFPIEVRHGRPTAIPIEVEEKIVKCVKVAAERGVGMTRRQLMRRVDILCKRMQIQTPYPDFKAGKNWWEGVKKRHGLTLRQPERLATSRCRMMNPEVVRKYFEELGKLLEKLDLKDKPGSIWNCDETGKNFEHSPVRVVAEKGIDNVCSRTSNKGSNITIMACVSAAGKVMPPMIVAKGKTQRSLQSFNTRDTPKGTMWSYQENGWMTDELGEQWFNSVFLKHCGLQRPQLLILDGHSSHESLAILQRAIEENIFIMALPPHTTHHLQPLDKSVFGPFNKAYNAACSELLQDPLQTVNKWTFPALINTAWTSSLTEGNIKSGFAACGIFPFNCQAVSKNAYAPSQPTDKQLAYIQCISDEQSSGEQYPSTSGEQYPSTSGEQHPSTSGEQYPSTSGEQYPSTSGEIANVELTASFFATPINSPGNTSNQSVDLGLRRMSSDIGFDTIIQPQDGDVDFADVVVDPQTVLDIITSGDFVVDGEVDIQLPLPTCDPPNSLNDTATQSHDLHSVVTPPSATQSHDLHSVVTPPSALADWNADINAMFLPPVPHCSNQKQNKKQITAHRLLTSDEIIQQKIEKENKKLLKQSKSGKGVRRLLPVKKETKSKGVKRLLPVKRSPQI